MMTTSDGKAEIEKLREQNAILSKRVEVLWTAIAVVGFAIAVSLFEMRTVILLIVGAGVVLFLCEHTFQWRHKLREKERIQRLAHEAGISYDEFVYRQHRYYAVKAIQEAEEAGPGDYAYDKLLPRMKARLAELDCNWATARKVA